MTRKETMGKCDVNIAFIFISCFSLWKVSTLVLTDLMFMSATIFHVLSGAVASVDVQWKSHAFPPQ